MTFGKSMDLVMTEELWSAVGDKVSGVVEEKTKGGMWKVFLKLEDLLEKGELWEGVRTGKT